MTELLEVLLVVFPVEIQLNISQPAVWDLLVDVACQQNYPLPCSPKVT